MLYKSKFNFFLMIYPDRAVLNRYTDPFLIFQDNYKIDELSNANSLNSDCYFYLKITLNYFTLFK